MDYDGAPLHSRLYPERVVETNGAVGLCEANNGSFQDCEGEDGGGEVSTPSEQQWSAIETFLEAEEKEEESRKMAAAAAALVDLSNDFVVDVEGEEGGEEQGAAEEEGFDSGFGGESDSEQPREVHQMGCQQQQQQQQQQPSPSSSSSTRDYADEAKVLFHHPSSQTGYALCVEEPSKIGRGVGLSRVPFSYTESPDGGMRYHFLNVSSDSDSEEDDSEILKSVVVSSNAYQKFKRDNPGFMPSDDELGEEEEEKEKEKGGVPTAAAVVNETERGEGDGEEEGEEDDDTASTVAYGRSTPFYDIDEDMEEETSWRHQRQQQQQRHRDMEEEEEEDRDEDEAWYKPSTPVLKEREAKRLARKRLLLIKELEDEEDQIAWEEDEVEEWRRPDTNGRRGKALSPSSLSDIIHGYRLRADILSRKHPGLSSSSSSSLPPPPPPPSPPPPPRVPGCQYPKCVRFYSCRNKKIPVESPPLLSPPASPPASVSPLCNCPADSAHLYSCVKASSDVYGRQLENDLSVKRLDNSEPEAEGEEEEKREIESRRRKDKPLDSSYEDLDDQDDFERYRPLLHRPSDHFPPPKHSAAAKYHGICGATDLEPTGLAKDVCKMMARVTTLESHYIDEVASIRNDHHRLKMEIQDLERRVGECEVTMEMADAAKSAAIAAAAAARFR